MVLQSDIWQFKQLSISLQLDITSHPGPVFCHSLFQVPFRTGRKMLQDASPSGIKSIMSDIPSA